ncbi:hypothetical protein VTN02DRAFT_4596 [Thermoascus thermophilus]
MPQPEESPLDLLICSTCGSQHAVTTGLSSCKICDDPRQYLPAQGQSWTTLRSLQSSPAIGYRNEFVIETLPNPNLNRDCNHCLLVSIHTVPRLAIGQRALLCCSPRGGNVLWDCLTYLDDDTVARVAGLGGVRAIVVFPPALLRHVSALGRGVRVSGLSLLSPASTGGDPAGDPADGDGDAPFVAIKTGGHFPRQLGAVVGRRRASCWWPYRYDHGRAERRVSPPVVVDHRLPGTVSFSFMWSYPNLVRCPFL